MTTLAELVIRIKSLEAVQAKERLDKLEKSAGRAEKATDRLDSSSSKMRKSIDQMNRSMATTVRNLGLVTAGFVGLAGARRAVDTLTEVERSLVAIAKTADLAEQAMVSYGNRFRDIVGRGLTTPLVRLQELGAVAGQLGVRGKDILLFAETIGKLETATSDIKGEEAALALARLLNLAGEGTDQVDKLASVIVRLGNNFAATEGQIVRAATFIGQSTAAFNVSSAEVAGIATAVAATGQRAETAATALARLFILTNQAVGAGGDQLRKFASIAGASADEFANAWSTSPVAAIEMFLKGLNRLVVGEGQDFNSLLSEIGVTSAEAIRVLGPLVTRVDILSDALAQARDEFIQNSALTKEYERQLGTLDTKFKQLNNAATVFVLSLGDAGARGGLKGFLDTIKESLLVLAGVPGSFAAASGEAKLLAIAFGALASAIIGLGLGAFLGFLAKAVVSVTLLTEAVVTLNFALISNPIGAVVTALGAIAAIIGGVITGFRVFNAELTEAGRRADQLVDSLDNVGASLNKIKFGESTKDIDQQVVGYRELIQQLQDVGTAIQDVSQLRSLLSEDRRSGFIGQLSNLGIGNVDDLLKAFDALRNPALSRDPRDAQGILNTIQSAFTSKVAGRIDEIRNKIAELTGVSTEAQEAVAGVLAPGGEFGPGQEAANRFLGDLEKSTALLREQRDNGKNAAEILAVVQEAYKSFAEVAVPNQEEVIQKIREQVMMQQELRRQIEQTEQAEKAALEASKKRREGLLELEQLQANLARELDFISLSNDQRQIELQLLEFQNAAKAAGLEYSISELEVLREKLKLVQDTNKARNSTGTGDSRVFTAQTQIERARADLGIARESLGRSTPFGSLVSGDGRARAQANRDLSRFTGDNAPTPDQIEELTKINRQAEQFQAYVAIIEDVASGIGDAFGGLARDLIDRKKEISDIMADFGDRILNSLIESLVVKPVEQLVQAGVSSFLGGFLPSAKGNVFGPSGHLHQFAKGGVFGGPTFFRFGAGDLGVLGEKGTEAVMPLGRTPSGELGVKNVGGGGGGGSVSNTTINYSPRMNFYGVGGDQASMRSVVGRSLRQSEQRLRETRV